MKFDIIVVGGGHAGIEAANIAARMGCSVLLVTSHLDLIGQMSCNPAIGGIAKGNIVREIDALGGLMGRLIDKTGIQFRMLNRSKGAAVWGPRAQADKVAYRKRAKAELERVKNIDFLQGMVRRISGTGDTISGIVMDSGEKIECGAVVLTMGTFLNGVIHIGLTSFPGGRSGEPPSTELTESIAEFGIKSGRLKTGTPPRIDARTVQFDLLEKQAGDETPWPFSYATDTPPTNRAVCWISKTNAQTHRIIRENLDRSPLYSGKIKSIGPRYCPSIEDKVVKFGERDGHILFLEPESVDNPEMYLNGLSTSLPFDVQVDMVRSIRGLKNARILRPGYGIEYDFFQPVQLRKSLESKAVGNLFFAGQINGTSGYEEAACQGLVAGINAVQKIRGEKPLVLSRESSYTGVLIDDLVTRGTEEPYRMFTSRAEHRLLLRQDNCDERLMPIAFALGLIDAGLFERRQRVWERKKEAIEALKRCSVAPEAFEEFFEEKLHQPVKAADLLRRPTVTLDRLVKCCDAVVDASDRELRTAIEAEIKYSGFIARESADIERVSSLEEAKIPEGFDYRRVKGLLTESMQKFLKQKPGTLGQASRISGVTPADVSILALHIAKEGAGTVSRETEHSTEWETP